MRDETERVISKCQKYQWGCLQISTHLTRPSDLRSGLTSARLDLGIIDRAIPFFFSHYVHQPEPFSKRSKRGYYEYLPSLYLRSDPNGPLVTTVHAAAIASFANAGNAQDWIPEAYRLYGLAVMRTQAALINPQDVKSDDILAAVMLLGTFEVSDPCPARIFSTV
jgi:Fungal specific transcription factor domain